jgi:hypothetical protein
MTIHNINSAGATAAVPMTVGMDSNILIVVQNRRFFAGIYSRKRVVCRSLPSSVGDIPAATADAIHACIDDVIVR